MSVLSSFKTICILINQKYIPFFLSLKLSIYKPLSFKIVYIEFQVLAQCWESLFHMNGNYNPDIQALVVRWHCVFYIQIFTWWITIYCFISEFSNFRFTPCLWTSSGLYFLTLVFYYKTIFVLLHVRILIGGLIQLFQYLKKFNEIIF